MWSIMFAYRLWVKWNLLTANGGGVPRGKWVIHGGVPHHSVLGRLLFLIYIYVKKQTRQFGIQRMNKTWSYSHLNKATFIAPPVSSIPPNFHRYGVLYSETILKKMFFQLLLIFHYFIGVVPPKYFMWSWLYLLIVYDFKC